MADVIDPLPGPALAGGYGPRYRRGGTYWLNAMIGTAALLITCLCLHAVLPLPYVPDISPKLRYFAAHKNEFDTLFIGSSRIYRHVNPNTFDRVTAELGRPTHSFNLAVGGMDPPETFHVLQQALRTKPARLKWVFLEFEELNPTWSEQKRKTRRFIYWHDWRLTMLAVGKSINPDGSEPWLRALPKLARSEARVHLLMLIQNFVNVGRAQDLWSFAGEQESHSSDLETTRGYQPHPKTMTPQKSAAYETRLARGQKEAPQRTMDRLSDRAFRDCIQQIDRAGANFIGVVPPIASRTQLRFSTATPPSRPVLAFNDGLRYPMLYDRAVRIDVHHLTAEGADMFTRLLAERFVAEVATIAPP